VYVVRLLVTKVALTAVQGSAAVISYAAAHARMAHATVLVRDIILHESTCLRSVFPLSIDLPPLCVSLENRLASALCFL
jgi:hypothetical protein